MVRRYSTLVVAAAMLLVSSIAAIAASSLWPTPQKASGLLLPPVAQPPQKKPAGAVVAPAQALHMMAQPAYEAAAGLPPMTLRKPDGTGAHFLHTPAITSARKALRKRMHALQKAGASGGPMIYHAGGSIMTPPTAPYVLIYTIFWAPPALQSGNPASFSATYGGPQTLIAAWLPEHGLFNIATEYYQTVGSTTSYIANLGGRAGFAIDTNPLPASGCQDTAVPVKTDCITDAQLTAEIQKVMAANGWTPGINKLYMVFLPKNLGTCFDSASTQCAYTQFCGYHSYFYSSGQPVVYSNEPYGNADHCWTGLVSPNNDVEADSAVSVATHEIMEAVTDPLLNAWFDSSGNEIGDICAWNFGNLTWTGNGAAAPNANQMYNGWYFTMQQEWSNHQNACALHGP